MPTRSVSWTAVLLATFATPAQGQILCTWNGTGGNWLNPALWSPAVPNNGTPLGATYDAHVLNGPGPSFQILMTEPITVQNMVQTGGEVRGASLTVLGSMSLSGNARLGVDNVAVQGPMNITNGQIIGGTVFVTGGATINQLTLGTGGGGSGNLKLGGAASTWASGDINTIASACRIDVVQGSTLNIAGDGIFADNSVGTGFSNSGTVRKQGGTGLTDLKCRLIDNSGLIDVLTGRLTGNGGGFFSSIGIQNRGVIHTGPNGTVGGDIDTRDGGRVFGSGTLGGSGSNDIKFFTGGRLQPGDGVGAMSLSAGVQMSGGGILEMELLGNVPGTGYDQLRLGTDGVLSLVTLTTGPTLSLTLGYAPEPTDALTLLTSSGTSPQVTGTFANAPQGGLLNLGMFNNIRYSGIIHYSAHSIVLDSFVGVPIPEPGSLLLAAIGLAAFVRMRLSRPVAAT